MTYDSNIRNEEIDRLMDGIVSLENSEECYKFFTDVCTVKEIQSIAQRFQVARMLAEKKTYAEIKEVTEASSATISRVNRFLMYGDGGYKIALRRLKECEEQE